MRNQQSSKVIAGTVFVAIVGLLSAGFAARGAAEAFIVKDGKPEAEIVVPEKPNRIQELAADELRHFIKKISGAELKIANQPTKEFPVKIYVGASELTRKLGVRTDDLKDSAYRMVSGDDYLVLAGDDAPRTFKGPGGDPFRRSKKDTEEAIKKWDELVGHSRWVCPGAVRAKGYSKQLKIRYDDHRGTLMAVYGFLRSLGARWYFPGEFGECLPEMKTIPIPKVNETVKPDFPMRHFGGSAYNSFGKIGREQALWILRLGLGGLDIGGVHGINNVIHRDQTRKEHPDWYLLKNGTRDTTSRGGKPCLSSEGLFKDNVDFCRTFFDVYDGDVISVMPTDAYTVLCECEKCEGKDSPELGYSGQLSNYAWNYVNEVAKEVYKTHPDKKIVCCAYGSYHVPPPAIDKFSPNVMVKLNNGRGRQVDPEVRKSELAFRQEWLKKLTGKRPFDTHDNYTNFGRSPFPCFIPRFIAEDIRSLKDVCVGEYVEETSLRPQDLRGDEPPVKLAINHLNIYVTARMWWDADQDINKVLDEYYQNFYGPAAKEMKAFIEYSEKNWPKMKDDAERITKAIELLAAAKKAAGTDSIYAKRVGLIAEYLKNLEKIRDQVAVGRDNNPSIQVDRLKPDQTITIDGELDDPFWKEAERHPLDHSKTGEKPKVGAWFKMGWKGNDLYVAIHCDEPNVKDMLLIAKDNENPALWEGDCVELILETPNHAYYQIAMNAAGALIDADRERGVKTLWNSQAELATHVGENGWNLEVRVPVANEAQAENLPNELVSGSHPSKEKPWYFNVGRVRRSKDDMEISMFTEPGKKAFHTKDKFARLTLKSND